VLAAVWAARIPVPDVLVANDGRTFAVRGGDGRLAFHHTGGDTFAIHEWLAGDADGRDLHDRALGQGIACDTSGCIGKLADGALVAYVTAPDAFEEDCARAILIVTAHEPPPGCAAFVIGRKLWRTHGALALRRSGSGFVIGSARPASFDRPWAPAPQHSRLTATAGADADAAAPTLSRAPPRDATPRPEDIEADQ
jgi:competence protein ComEC